MNLLSNVQMSFLQVSTYIITSITAHAIKLTLILEIMSVSTLKSAAILYLHYNLVDENIFKSIFTKLLSIRVGGYGQLSTIF